MYCLVCDIEYPKSLRFCKWCGGGLVEKDKVGTQHCPACGSSVNREWLFCNECGIDLASIGAQPKDQVCPSCSAAVRKGWMYCRQCGEQIVTERAELRCAACGAGMREGWKFCKQCGGGVGGAIPAAARASRDLGTVVGIPAVGVQYSDEDEEDEPFSNLHTGDLPSVDDVITSDRGKKGKPGAGKPAAPSSATLPPGGAPREDRPVAGGTHSFTFDKSTGQLGQRELDREYSERDRDARASTAPPAGPGEAADAEALRTIQMQALPKLGPPPTPAAPAPNQASANLSGPKAGGEASSGYEVPSAFSSQPTVAVPAIRPEDFLAAQEKPQARPPAAGDDAKGGFEAPSAFSNQPTMAIPAVNAEELQANLQQKAPPPAGDAGSYQVPAAFSSQPTIAIPAITTPEPEPEPLPPTGGREVPAAFSGVPTVAIPALPSEPQPPAPQYGSGAFAPGANAPMGDATSVVPQQPSAGLPPSDATVAFQPSQPLGVPPSDATAVVPQAPQSPQYPQAPPLGQPTVAMPAVQTGSVPPYATPQTYPQPAVQGSYPAPSAAPEFAPPVQVAAEKKGGSALKWVAVALGLLSLLAVAGVGAILYVRSRQAAPSVAEQPTAPVTTPTPTPTPAPTAPVAPVAAVPDGMVLVEGGTFTLGSDAPTADEYSKPAHPVTLKSFYIDKTEVTNAEYAKFVAATSHTPPEGWSGSAPPPGSEQLPVVNVNWNDATAYANWAGKRLPTESEWEVAARGTDGRLYPWGSTWDPSVANTGKKDTDTFMPVGSFPAGASPCGALDMIGNAWEWTSSDFEQYPGSTAPWPVDSKTGKEQRPIKIMRGGAFDGGEKINATWRAFRKPDLPGPRLGFRCAKDK